MFPLIQPDGQRRDIDTRFEQDIVGGVGHVQGRTQRFPVLTVQQYRQVGVAVRVMGTAGTAAEEDGAGHVVAGGDEGQETPYGLVGLPVQFVALRHVLLRGKDAADGMPVMEEHQGYRGGFRNCYGS